MLIAKITATANPAAMTHRKTFDCPSWPDPLPLGIIGPRAGMPAFHVGGFGCRNSAYRGGDAGGDTGGGG
jgi:hypothetical protein